jgi:hypothetical protein
MAEKLYVGRIGFATVPNVTRGRSTREGERVLRDIADSYVACGGISEDMGECFVYGRS